MDKKNKGEWYFAACEVNADAYDPYEGLEEGTIVLDKDQRFGDIYKPWDTDSLKWFCKRTKSYICNLGTSLTFVKKGFNKKIVGEATTAKFEHLLDMENFAKDNRGMLIYQIIDLEIDDVKLYFLRYFKTPKKKIIRLNWFSYIRNKLFVWKKKSRNP